MARSQPAPCGLFAHKSNASIPVKDVSVRARVQGYVCALDSTLKYENDSEEPLEVVFRFPVDDSLAVVGLEAVIGGRRIRAEVHEKEEARQVYDDALASGYSAALGEDISGDILSVTLGNLPPKGAAEVHLLLATELPLDADGAVRFTLPSVLKPRYTPSGFKDPLAQVGYGARVHRASVPGVFHFNLEVIGEEGVSAVDSPTHPIKKERKDGSVYVELSQDCPLEKDLVILVHYGWSHEPQAITEAGGEGEGFMARPSVMLNFFPKFESTQAACEFVFVVDRSGSMRGEFIKNARETLILFLKSIPPGCYFNIIGFGSNFKSLFPESVPYNQSNLDLAVQHAESMQADFGGTELLRPLEYIFQQRLLPGLPRQVFVLTDGSVSNTHACIKAVQKNVRHSRCFTFGIGSGASTALVKGLAKAGNGTAEFVMSGERMQPKVISSLKRALQPSVTDLTVDFKVPDEYEVQVAPQRLPTIFSGDKAVVYGVFKPKEDKLRAAVKGEAILRGKITGKSIEHSISFEIPPTQSQSSPSSQSVVHHLAAMSLIKDWQEDAKRKADVIKLSIESNALSQHTAYVAVDEDQEKPIEGAIQLWDVTASSVPSYFAPFNYSSPIMMSRSRGPSPAYALSAPSQFIPLCSRRLPTLKSAPPPPPPPGGVPPPGGLPPPPPPSGGIPPPPAAPAPRGFGGIPPRSLPAPKGAPSPQHSAQVLEKRAKNYGRPSAFLRATTLGGTPTSSKAMDALSTLITLQQAFGNWNLDAPLASALGKSLSQLESGYPGKCEEEVKSIWATVLALVFLERKHAAQRDEWELVSMKAEMWLQGQNLPDTLDTLKEAAHKCL